MTNQQELFAVECCGSHHIRKAVDLYCIGIYTKWEDALRAALEDSRNDCCYETCRNCHCNGEENELTFFKKESWICEDCRDNRVDWDRDLEEGDENQWLPETEDELDRCLKDNHEVFGFEYGKYAKWWNRGSKLFCISRNIVDEEDKEPDEVKQKQDTSPDSSKSDHSEVKLGLSPESKKADRMTNQQEPFVVECFKSHHIREQADLGCIGIYTKWEDALRAALKESRGYCRYQLCGDHWLPQTGQELDSCLKSKTHGEVFGFEYGKYAKWWNSPDIGSKLISVSRNIVDKEKKESDSWDSEPDEVQQKQDTRQDFPKREHVEQSPEASLGSTQTRIYCRTVDDEGKEGDSMDSDSKQDEEHEEPGKVKQQQDTSPDSSKSDHLEVKLGLTPESKKADRMTTGNKQEIFVVHFYIHDYKPGKSIFACIGIYSTWELAFRAALKKSLRKEIHCVHCEDDSRGAKLTFSKKEGWICDKCRRNCKDLEKAEESELPETEEELSKYMCEYSFTWGCDYGEDAQWWNGNGDVGSTMTSIYCRTVDDEGKEGDSSESEHDEEHEEERSPEAKKARRGE